MELEQLSARIIDDDTTTSLPAVFIIVILVLALLLSAVLVSIFLLSATRKRRIREAYYDDFEMGDERLNDVISGDMKDREDPDWDDMLE